LWRALLFRIQLLKHVAVRYQQGKKCLSARIVLYISGAHGLVAIQFQPAFQPCFLHCGGKAFVELRSPGTYAT
jgi:hypothetical protein